MLNQLLKFFRVPIKYTKISIILLILSIVITIYLATSSRLYQLDVWKANETTFFATGTPMMTTLDAYKFFRHAKEYHNGEYDIKAKDPMIFYPERVDFPKPVPLISVLLDKFATFFDTNVYNVSLYMMPILSGLFVIPLAIYFFMLGYPALGVLGALIGIFAPMYAGRTSLGRVDADSMILFFSFLASLFIYLAMRIKDKNRYMTYLYSALAGLTVGTFYYWYHHGAFTISYFVILIVMLALSKVRVRDIIISALLYVFFSNPFYFSDAFFQMVHSVNTYLFPITKSTSIFPNVYSTISEAQKTDIMQSLSYVISSPFIVILGLIGAFIFAIFNFKNVIPLAPVLMLGMMTFISSSRFSMFLGPTVGIGIAYIIHLIITHIKTKNVRYAETIKIVSLYALSFLFFILVTVSGGNSYRFVPGPSIQTVVYQYFKEMKKVLPPDSNIYTWWDFGLAITDATGFKVFHSGMTQESPKTYLIAKSLSSDQHDLYNIASYLDNFGISELDNLTKDNASLNKVMSYITSYDKGPKSDRDYILFTDDMIQKYSAITFLSSWNNETKKATPRSFARLQCAGLDSSGNLQCAGELSFNLNIGIISGGKGTLIASYDVNATNQNTENSVNEKKYSFTNGYYLITVRGYQTQYYLVEKDMFESPFVQLYLLNKPDERYFENVAELDYFPFARLFRIKQVQK